MKLPNKVLILDQNTFLSKNSLQKHIPQTSMIISVFLTVIWQYFSLIAFYEKRHIKKKGTANCKLKSLAVTDCAALEMLLLLLIKGTVLAFVGSRGPDLGGRRLLVGGSERLTQNGLNLS